MSFKTTNKEVNRNYLTFRCGYCAVQNILNYENPIAHTEGIYGWNSDIYVRGGMAISTGYRPTGIDGYQSIIEKYDKQAEEIRYSKEFPPIDKTEKLQELCTAMWRELQMEWRFRSGDIVR